jgi:hypothetical protein
MGLKDLLVSVMNILDLDVEGTISEDGDDVADKRVINTVVRIVQCTDCGKPPDRTAQTDMPSHLYYRCWGCVQLGIDAALRRKDWYDRLDGHRRGR